MPLVKLEPGREPSISKLSHYGPLNLNVSKLKKYSYKLAFLLNLTMSVLASYRVLLHVAF